MTECVFNTCVLVLALRHSIVLQCNTRIKWNCFFFAFPFTIWHEYECIGLDAKMKGKNSKRETKQMKTRQTTPSATQTHEWCRNSLKFDCGKKNSRKNYRIWRVLIVYTYMWTVCVCDYMFGLSLDSLLLCMTVFRTLNTFSPKRFCWLVGLLTCCRQNFCKTKEISPKRKTRIDK